MRTQSRSDAALLAAVSSAFLLAASVPVALGSDPPRAEAQAGSLSAAGESLEARAQTATLELYALETRLERARSALADIAVRRSAVEREGASTGRQLAIAERALRASEARVGELVRALYQQTGATEPLEVVLGARSLDEAMAGLEGLDRAAAQSAEIIERARQARQRLGAARSRLARRATELQQLGAAAKAEANELAATVVEREAYVAGLRRRQELDAARIAAIQVQARVAGSRAVPPAVPVPDTAAAPPAATVAPVRAAAARRTLTVTSTGYILRGYTASGMPTAVGVVAVDPSVIPLGTRMTVPGYGEAIAADTGGAVIGNTIDLWFPTLEQAHRWGRRTVTITLH